MRGVPISALQPSPQSRSSNHSICEFQYPHPHTPIPSCAVTLLCKAGFQPFAQCRMMWQIFLTRDTGRRLGQNICTTDAMLHVSKAQLFGLSKQVIVGNQYQPYMLGTCIQQHKPPQLFINRSINNLTGYEPGAAL